MIETDQQRRWWFANHPEYSRHGGSRGGRQAVSGKVTPEAVDAYVDESVKHVPEQVRRLLELFKKHFGTGGASQEHQSMGATAAAETGHDQLSEATSNGTDKPARPSELEEISKGRPSYEGPLTYEKGLEDGMRWTLDPKRGPGPPLVLNPDYIRGFGDGVTHIWQGAKTATDLWNSLSGAGGDTWDTIRNFPFGYGLSSGSRRLGNTLEEAGEPRPSQFHDAHHLAAENHPRAQPARDVLNKYDIPIHGKGNGAWVHRSQHGSLNSHYNLDAVNEALKPATSREDALRILRAIKRALPR